MSEAAVARVPAPRRVCLFGTYAGSHTSTQLLRHALRAAGCELTECHSPLWEGTRDKMPAYFRSTSLVRLGMAYVAAIRHLARTAPREQDTELYVVGFNGQLDVLGLRFLRRRAPVLFAPLVTITETLIEDRGVYSARAPLARLMRTLDRLSLRLADHILIDTEAHRRYLVQEHGAQAEKVTCWHLGADGEVFRPCTPPTGDVLRVLFYGQFLPLHGVETIFRAIATLASNPAFQFTVIGTGPERSRALRLLPPVARDRVRLIEWVPYRELGGHVAAADVCLGSFGASVKAQMVIPNKVYQAANVGRAIVTADTPALREVFTPGRDVVACPPGDPVALAGALVRLRNRDERSSIARRARQLMRARFAPEARVARFRAVLEAVHHR